MERRGPGARARRNHPARARGLHLPSPGPRDVRRARALALRGQARGHRAQRRHQAPMTRLILPALLAAVVAVALAAACDDLPAIPQCGEIPDGGCRGTTTTRTTGLGPDVRHRGLLAQRPSGGLAPASPRPTEAGPDVEDAAEGEASMSDVFIDAPPGAYGGPGWTSRCPIIVGDGAWRAGTCRGAAGARTCTCASTAGGTCGASARTRRSWQGRGAVRGDVQRCRRRSSDLGSIAATVNVDAR